MASIAEINGLTIPASGGAFLLDQSYASGAAAAYSIRRLKSSTGALIRVRRVTGVGNTGNDDEADFSYDSNNELSLNSPISNADAGVNSTTLGSFLNVGTVNGVTYPDTDSLTNTAEGYCDSWYDQSGNSNDATQSTPGSQPQIHGGTVNTDLNTVNGKTAFTQGSRLSSTFSSSISQPVSIYTTHVDLGTNNFHEGITNNLMLRGHGGKYGIKGDSSAVLLLNSPTRAQLLNSQVLVYNLYDGADSEIAVDGNTAQTGTIDTNGTSGFVIRTSGITRQEFLVFEADNTNRSNIESNINSYYTIY